MSTESNAYIALCEKSLYNMLQKHFGIIHFGDQSLLEIYLKKEQKMMQVYNYIIYVNTPHSLQGYYLPPSLKAL